MVNQIRRLGVSPEELILPSSLGPIGVANLPFLQGWRYSLFNMGFPGAEIPLVNGGPSVTLVDYTDEIGWILLFGFISRSPYCTMNFNVDNFNYTSNVFFANILGLNTPLNIHFRVGAYNPATPLGPLYSMIFDPTYAMPYQSHCQITLSLPATVPVPGTTIFAAYVGKIYIVDYTLFMRSVKRFIAEQMVGKKLDRYL